MPERSASTPQGSAAPLSASTAAATAAATAAPAAAPSPTPPPTPPEQPQPQPQPQPLPNGEAAVGGGGGSPRFIEVDGPVDSERTLITYDLPFAPDDPKKTMKLLQRLGVPPETRTADPNAVAIIDSFIKPRTWVEGGVRWVQKASPFPAARVDTVRTMRLLRRHERAMGARDTGVCAVRTHLHGECFIEVIRQVVADCWERGLLLLKVHAERVDAQRAHRELFESRTGYAFRLALKGEKDTAAMVSRIEMLKERKVSLAQEEVALKEECKELEVKFAEQLLVDEKRCSDEITALKKEANHKKNQLEALTAPLPKQ